MDELKTAWERYLIDSNQEKLLQIVEKHIPDDFDPDYKGSDEWFIEAMNTPFLETHRICDIELCGKFFTVTRTSDSLETLSITPTNSPAFDFPGIPYSLSGKKLLQFIQDKRQALNEESTREAAIFEAEEEEWNRKDPVPLCSSIVRFIPKDTRFDGCGEIIMKAIDIEQFINDENYNAGEVLGWLSNRDDSEHNETLVPRQWINKFEYIAYSLLEKKKVSAWCSKCQTEYSENEMKEDVDPHPIGWINGRFLCPEDHILIEIELMHAS